MDKFGLVRTLNQIVGFSYPLTQDITILRAVTFAVFDRPFYPIRGVAKTVT
jgi:hypothetical protein